MKRQLFYLSCYKDVELMKSDTYLAQFHSNKISFIERKNLTTGCN